MTTHNTVSAIAVALEKSDFGAVRTILFLGEQAKQANAVNLSDLSRWILDRSAVDFEAVGALSDYADAIKARLVQVWGPVERSEQAEQVYKSFNTILQRTARDQDIKLSITRARNAKKPGALFEFDAVEVELHDYDQAKAQRKADKADEQEQAKAALIEQAFADAGLDPNNLPRPVAGLKQRELVALFVEILEHASPTSRAKMAALLSADPEQAAEQQAA